jgi:leucyl-tRNA synthetase
MDKNKLSKGNSTGYNHLWNLMSYQHTEIDLKWQNNWAKSECFKAQDQSQMPKYYALDMFP